MEIRSIRRTMAEWLLVESVKKAIKSAIGNIVVSYAEFETICYEAANIVNERPIGVHPRHLDEDSYLCPNGTCK